MRLDNIDKPRHIVQKSTFSGVAKKFIFYTRLYSYGAVKYPSSSFLTILFKLKAIPIVHSVAGPGYIIGDAILAAARGIPPFPPGDGIIPPFPFFLG